MTRAAQIREAIRRLLRARRLLEAARDYRDAADEMQDEAARLVDEARELEAGRTPLPRLAGAVLPDLRH